jgi:hypothetical protein
MPPSGIHAQIRSPGYHRRGQAAAARAATVACRAHRAGNPKRNSDEVRPLPPPWRGGCGDRVGDGKEGSNLARAGGARGPAEGAGDGGERHVVVKSAACAWEGRGRAGRVARCEIFHPRSLPGMLRARLVPREEEGFAVRRGGDDGRWGGVWCGAARRGASATVASGAARAGSARHFRGCRSVGPGFHRVCKGAAKLRQILSGNGLILI